jgi:hypothetical protein
MLRFTGVVVVLCAAGCGTNETAPGDGGADATNDGARDAVGDVGDAAPGDDAADASVDVGPPVACEAGVYFVIANDPPLMQVLQQGCGDAGPPAPTAGTTLCGEDCECGIVQGCEATVALRLDTGGCGVGIQVGVWPVHARFSDGEGGAAQGWGKMRIKTVGPVGGTVSGDYVTALVEVDGGDGGVLTGTFCAQHVE